MLESWRVHFFDSCAFLTLSTRLTNKHSVLANHKDRFAVPLMRSKPIYVAIALPAVPCGGKMVQTFECIVIIPGFRHRTTPSTNSNSGFATSPLKAS
jgi:hypothetical protein